MRVRIPILGSLTVAVILLIAIAAVLAWGTMYETRFGTAAVQQFIYHSWWFQLLLAFLVVNLAVSVIGRLPWQRKHVPFLLAHLGIILILLGGILGGRFGIEGQLVISEGESNRSLMLPHNVLVIRDPTSGTQHAIPTRFEATAWIHEPHALFQVPLEGRRLRLVIDRYYPDATMEERIEDGSATENPSMHLMLRQQEDQHDVWLFPRDPERFGARWGNVHVLFLEPQTERQVVQLVEQSTPNPNDHGTLTIEFPDLKIQRQVPVPQDFSQPVTLEGTAYRITFKQYFTDFAITERGVANQSDQPNNPAIAFAIAGPEGEDSFLAFALHPDFQMIHNQHHAIHAHVTYQHASDFSLPPQSVCVVRPPAGDLFWLMTGAGGERQKLALEIGKPVRHPWMDVEVEAKAYFPKAQILQQFHNRGNEVKAEALHVMVQEGRETAQTWLTLRKPMDLQLGTHPIVVEYRPAQWDLPVTVKLLDFRKIDYPGTQMAQGFESDVELTDPRRSLVLTRTISMNNPLKYQGFSFFQSSYVPGEAETTVLSVRNDPGTPLVYAGFLIVIGGVVSMFLLRTSPTTR